MIAQPTPEMDADSFFHSPAFRFFSWVFSRCSQLSCFRWSLILSRS